MLQLSLTANVVGISATPTPPTLAGGILNDVEHEPGLVWPTVTMPTATPPSVLVPNFKLSKPRELHMGSFPGNRRRNCGRSWAILRHWPYNGSSSAHY